MYACTWVHTDIHTHTHTHTRTHTHTQTHTHTHTQTHTHTHTNTMHTHNAHTQQHMHTIHSHMHINIQHNTNAHDIFKLELSVILSSRNTRKRQKHRLPISLPFIYLMILKVLLRSFLSNWNAVMRDLKYA